MIEPIVNNCCNQLWCQKKGNKNLGKHKIFYTWVYMIFKYGKQFHLCSIVYPFYPSAMYENFTFEYDILSIVKKILNLSYQTYLIAGDDTCRCIYWKECRWSKAAVFSVVGVAQESEEFKEVRKMIQQYTCDGPEDNYVTCCGRDQKPSEDDPFIDRIGNSFFFSICMCKRIFE